MFTPDDEPYLGLLELQALDEVLVVLARQQQQLGPWTRAHELSLLQQAAAELVPGASSIAFSIRELIRQGYLLSARILVRPLAERVSTLAYLVEHEEAVKLWQTGWPHRSRPSLGTRLTALASSAGPAPEAVLQGLNDLRDDYNSLVHGDPRSALSTAILLDDGTAGYTTTKDLASPSRATKICNEAILYAMVLTLRCDRLFPPMG